MISYLYDFHLMMWLMICIAPLLLLLRRPKPLRPPLPWRSTPTDPPVAEALLLTHNASRKNRRRTAEEYGRCFSPTFSGRRLSA